MHLVNILQKSEFSDDTWKYWDSELSYEDCQATMFLYMYCGHLPEVNLHHYSLECLKLKPASLLDLLINFQDISWSKVLSYSNQSRYGFRIFYQMHLSIALRHFSTCTLLYDLLPVTHAQETCTRSLSSRLVQETCTCVIQSCTSFFLVQVACMQLSTALFLQRNCLAHDMNRTMWLAGELFWCKKLWWTCVKFFTQVSCTSFLIVCCRY